MDKGQASRISAELVGLGFKNTQGQRGDVKDKNGANLGEQFLHD